MRLFFKAIYFILPQLLGHVTAAREADHVINGNKSQGVSTFEPIGLALSTVPLSNVQKFQEFQLTRSVPVATLDYGYEVAGYPVFNVESFSGKVQIEVKYTEEFRGLQANFSDGPLSYAVALSNTYRVETFEIDECGSFEAFLLQGGQRWQSIRLLTAGTVKFSSVGFRASIATTDVNDLPGKFDCDNDELNEIWKLGARAASAACFEAGSQKAIWEVDDDGAFVRGMRPALTTEAAFFKDYTLEFDTKIERGGVGWVTAFPIASPVKGIQLNLVGELPANTTFVNTNTSMTPPNSILLGYGFSFVNVTTLDSYYLDTFNVSFSVKEGTWYRVKTILSGGEYLAVAINDTQIFNVSLAGYYVGSSAYSSGISTQGAFGFGGWQDQSGYFKNVVAYNTANGSLLYSNPMTNATQVIEEYGVHENYASVCLDGAKRDRLLWLGDFYHTVRVIAASTSMHDQAKGTLQFISEWQTADGLMPYAPPLGYNPSIASTAFATGGGGVLAGYELYGVLLADYQILGLMAFCNYIRLSNDLTFASESWSKWQLLVQWLIDQIDSTTGLPSLSQGFLGPSTGGSAISCAFVQALNMIGDVATAINDTSSASLYYQTADSMAEAVNNLLWNADLGVYSLSTSSLDDYSISAAAFCISSGTANSTQASSFISALSSLKAGPGYMDSTEANSSSSSTNISPNTNGFLLPALISRGTNETSQTALQLFKSLWGAMLKNNETSSGASWEYMNLAGEPGYGLFTSLSHPWGGAPTYVLPEWVTGLRAADGVSGFGYNNWILDPSIGLEMGLKRASAQIEMASGSTYGAQWIVTGEVMRVLIKAPKESRGTFVYGGVERSLSGATIYSFNVTMS